MSKYLVQSKVWPMPCRKCCNTMRTELSRVVVMAYTIPAHDRKAMDTYQLGLESNDVLTTARLTSNTVVREFGVHIVGLARCLPLEPGQSLNEERDLETSLTLLILQARSVPVTDLPTWWWLIGVACRDTCDRIVLSTHGYIC